MLTIRLSRVGQKNKPMYRLIISEKSKDPYGRALEILGSYNPHNKELQAKADRIKYWLSQGSGISPTANNLLIEKGIIEGEKMKASIARKKKKATEEKAEEKPAEAAKEAAPAESTEATPAEETKEEIPAETEKPAEEATEEKAE